MIFIQRGIVYIVSSISYVVYCIGESNLYRAWCNLNVISI